MASTEIVLVCGLKVWGVGGLPEYATYEFRC